MADRRQIRRQLAKSGKFNRARAAHGVKLACGGARRRHAFGRQARLHGAVHLIEQPNLGARGAGGDTAQGQQELTRKLARAAQALSERAARDKLQGVGEFGGALPPDEPLLRGRQQAWQASEACGGFDLAVQPQRRRQDVRRRPDALTRGERGACVSKTKRLGALSGGHYEGRA